MKTKTILNLCLLLLCTSTAFASFSIDWIRTPDIFVNSGTAIARDASDNVYTTSSTGSIYLEKRDRFGNFQWQVSSSTTVPFNYEFPISIHVDPQGNPVVVGYRHTVSSEGHFANSLILLKYDANGNLTYKKNLDGTYTYFNNSQYWTKVTSQMDNSGNLYIGTAGHVDGYPDWGFNSIKISPAGNIIRVSTKTFSSATNFHFVNQIRLKGNKIGLTGVTNYSSANATTWVLDTAGNDLWNSINTGIQGKDIAFDGNGNTYLLTWVSISFSGDVALYKFDANANQIGYFTYDFGGSDLASRMEMMPDGNLAIMAYGNTAPSGSYYVDWITFKVDLNGNKLWSKRFDKHSNNDEIPYMMAVDATNNIYVTGIAGPFPGGNNLGKRQMVTVKYSSTGGLKWFSAIDTLSEYQTGVGIAIASDRSLFVVGNVNTLIVHYLNDSGSDPCSSPLNISATGITDDGATVNWDEVSNANLYHLQFKPSTSATWQQLSTDATSLTLSSLFLGTTYDYRVEAICNSGPTGYSATQQFTTLGSGYCTSMGLHANKEWIDLVYLGTLLNSTPESDGGYADYTYLKTDLMQGGSYDITLSAGMNPGGFTEFWRVWIDYNQDGDFLDSGEKEIGYKSNQIGWETHTFQVPANASTGETRMRVSMKKGGPAQTPCETFNRGEVEDYTVNILPARMGTLSENPVDSKHELAIYPNPASTTITIDPKGFDGEVLTIELFDVTGHRLNIQKGEAAQWELDISSLSSGIYLISVRGESGNILTTKLIKE